MKQPGNADALQIIRSHLLQAVTKGDAAALEGHMAVYQAILKATGQGDTVGMLEHLAVYMAIINAKGQQAGRG